MIRVKTFVATGVAPDGKLYAGDLNAIQDAAAGKADFTQTVDMATLRIGDSAIQLLKFGTLDARLTAALRVDKILRALGGLLPAALTTTQRDALAVADRPYGLLILNTTTNRYEWNSGSDVTPNWQPVSPAIGTGSITTVEILDGTIVAADISATLKPSGSAGTGTEALRAIGSGSGQVVAGNDSRLTDTRTPTDNTVSTAKIQNNAVTPGKAKLDAAETWDFLGSLKSKGMNSHRHPYGNDRHIESGSGVTSGGGYFTANFANAFGSTPVAVAIPGTGQSFLGIDSIDANQVTFRHTNTGGGHDDGVSVWWIAEGQD